ncbi:protein arginine kinase activator [Natranaerovirga pectinivora]|uniref:Protein arginine kinase activator n=1 Tax=Natranaerovirga pectinivora TaxID=682400 RepID=A0A4R3ML30_9FIRM|nr:UvrB/UvrC motif-containing protein [Natranaerovirga pectinivora]TCT14262.1 protein arginine kinase activator [Natranaerovirga pectinivora]
MFCDRCEKKQATVYLTKIINGKKTEIHLCESCAAESEKFYLDSEISFQNLFSGLLDLVQNPQQVAKNTTDIKCPNCQLTYQTFKKTGKFGCSICFKTFESYLNPIFKRIHGSHIHTGKIPKNTKKELIIKRQIDDLRRKLNEAISKEEYEEAATLRDKIRKLEKGDGASC